MESLMENSELFAFVLQREKKKNKERKKMRIQMRRDIIVIWQIF